MITDLKIGDKVQFSTVYTGFYPNHNVTLTGVIQDITDEWIWVNWGLGEIWNHEEIELIKVE